MPFDFQIPPDRSGTGSLKWDKFAGRDVLPLWVADMDFPSPPAVIDALHRRADHGVFGYTVPYESVVEAVLRYLGQGHGINAEPQDLVWLPGLVPALNVACRAYCAPDEAVLTCTPVYPPFLTAPVNSGRELRTADLCHRDGRWHLDFEALEEAVTPKTRLFILCNPHNPVGTCFEREELVELLHFCERHDLVLCSDEIHCDLILDPVDHHPGLTLSDTAADRVVALYAPSKTYNVPGLACAFGVIPGGRLRAAFQRAARGLLTEVNAFGYAGCEAAYRHGEPWRQDLLNVLRTNRDTLYSRLGDHADRLGIHPMEATYLAWVDGRGMGVKNPATFFESHGIGFSDGEAFGWPGWFRINFGCPPATLEKALDRLDHAMETS